MSRPASGRGHAATLLRFTAPRGRRDTVQIMLNVAEVVTHATKAYESSQRTEEWLHKPAMGLDGQHLIDSMWTDDGAQLVSASCSPRMQRMHLNIGPVRRTEVSDAGTTQSCWH